MSRLWSDIHEGTSVEVPLVVTQKMLQAYSEISGDLNPLHLDESYARSRGFEREVVYGGMIVGAISRLIGMEMPGTGALWHHLDVDFKEPLYPEQSALIKGIVTYVNSELRVLRMDIQVTQGKRTIAKAEVQVGG